MGLKLAEKKQTQKKDNEKKEIMTQLSPSKGQNNYKSSFLSQNPLRKNPEEPTTPMERVGKENGYNKNNKNFDMLNQSPSVHNNTNYTYNTVTNRENSLLINPNNKNFDLYMGNQNQNQSYNYNQNNLNSIQHDANNRGQMQYYPPYNNNNINNNNIVSNNNNNRNEFYSSPNNNRALDASVLSTLSLSGGNPLRNQLHNETFNTTSTNINNNDPQSCPNCEDVYKVSIFRNLPLKIMKCVNCNNIINNNSLDFYLRKYKEDLIRHRINTINQETEQEELEKEQEEEVVTKKKEKEHFVKKKNHKPPPNKKKELLRKKRKKAHSPSQKLLLK